MRIQEPQRFIPTLTVAVCVALIVYVRLTFTVAEPVALTDTVAVDDIVCVCSTLIVDIPVATIVAVDVVWTVSVDVKSTVTVAVPCITFVNNSCVEPVVCVVQVHTQFCVVLTCTEDDDVVYAPSFGTSLNTVKIIPLKSTTLESAKVEFKEELVNLITDKDNVNKIAEVEPSEFIEPQDPEQDETHKGTVVDAKV